MILVQKKVTKSLDSFNINGILVMSEPLWRHTTFAAGGPADLYAVPADVEDLRKLIAAAQQAEMDYFILGGGSNLLVADAGFRGLVIDMRLFDDYRVHEDGSQLLLGAGLDISDAAWRSGSAGLKAVEGFFGMPGSVGGAVWMNARCYGMEISETFLWAEVMNKDGDIRRIEKVTEEWAYKISPFQNNEGIILRASFAVEADVAEELKEAMLEIRDDRESKGHYRAPCAGSAFKNNRSFGEPSGALIDKCGLKGLRVGGAAVSDWHGNILINDKGATAEEIHELLNKVAAKVEKETGFRMEREVRSIGDWNPTD